MVAEARKTNADIVEARLDYLNESVEIGILSEIKKPLIATCMPAWEGGRFSGTEEERIRILTESLEFASYVTVELAAKPKLRDKLIAEARKRKVAVIVAFHDFKKTPSIAEIRRIVARESRIGDIAKVAFTANNRRDVAAVLSILAEKKPESKLIAISMGSLGAISRIAGPMLGSYMAYGSLSESKKSAPGQFSVEELTRVFSILMKK